VTATRFNQIVIAGGGGAVGTLFADALLAAGHPAATVIDRRSDAAAPGRAGRVLAGDVQHPTEEARALVRACDLLILATPEPVAIAAAGWMLPEMKRDSLAVETLSVKSRYAAAVATIDTRAELLGVNPMFAPGLGFAGRSVVAVPYRCGGLAQLLLDFIGAQGSDIVQLSADEHDRACAALQVATHASVLAFGMALSATGYDLAAAERIMPPPHRTLLALLARILSGDPEVYRDIQSANPYAGRVRLDLLEAHRRLERIVASDDPEPFHALVTDLRRLLVGARTDYPRLCARLFEVDPRAGNQ
jgi:prephenate dehydrogenase